MNSINISDDIAQYAPEGVELPEIVIEVIDIQWLPAEPDVGIMTNYVGGYELEYSIGNDFVTDNYLKFVFKLINDYKLSIDEETLDELLDKWEGKLIDQAVEE